MNSIRKYTISLAVLFLLFISGCEKDFDTINTNPNAVTEASTPALLTQGIRDIAYNDFDVWYAGRQSSLVSQHFSQRNYTSEDRYGFRVNVTDGFFRNNFIYMTSFQQIIDLNTNPATKDRYANLYGDNNMQIAVAEIMKAYVFQLLTDYFGDIPYTQAMDILKYPQPAYDPQKTVYDGLIAKLEDAQTKLQTVLDNDGSGFETGDVFYGGDLEKWIKFANSLRLRLALRASNVDATYIAEAQDAIADGVMESIDDNAVFQFTSSGAPNESPWYNGWVVSNRNDFSFTARFLELLKGNSTAAGVTFTNPFSGLRDPRYSVYTSYTTDRLGVPYGMSDVRTQTWWSGNSASRVSILGRLGAGIPIIQPDFPTVFLDYPTVAFMVAEVNGMNAATFQEGIEASLEQWGATDAGNTYVNGIMARFNAAATPEAKKEIIITQKYIHLLSQPHEAWAEYRRTGYPKALVKPGEVTAVIGGTNVVFEAVPGSESGADIAARFKYPSSEFTLNKANVEAAVARMGEDTHAQRVWWDGGGKQ